VTPAPDQEATHRESELAVFIEQVLVDLPLLWRGPSKSPCGIKATETVHHCVDAHFTHVHGFDHRSQVDRSQVDNSDDGRFAVLARIPNVARNAPSEMTGKMFASFHTGSMDDQS